MKNSQIRNNQVTINKLNQKTYVVENGFFVEKLPEDAPADQIADKVAITEDSAQCFALVEDPNADDFSINEKNQLVVNGTPVVMGKIKLSKILAQSKNAAMLAVNEKDTGKIDIIVYNSRDGKFSQILYSGVVVKAIYQNVDGHTLVALEERRPVTETTKEGKVSTFEELLSSALLDFNFETNRLYTVTNDSGIIGEVIQESNDMIVFATNEKVNAYSPKAGATYDCKCTRDDDYDDDDCDEEEDDEYEGGYYARIDTSDKDTVKIVKAADSGAIEINTATIDGKLVKVAYTGRMYTFISNKVVLFGDGKVIDDEDAAALVAEHPYLVVTEKKDAVTAYTFASDAYETVKVVVTSTRDRGNIVTIE